MKTGFSQKKFGLLGEHLTHSFSPLIHKMLADYEYKIYDVEPQKLESFVKDGLLDGYNVTIPYKKAIMPFIDEISPEARAIGAINVVVRKDSKLYGYNTDYFGFSYMLDSAKINVSGKKALLFGNGGAAATIKAVLADRNIGELVTIDIADNTPENLARHADAKIIVNATPVGMYPNNRKAVVDLSFFPNCEAVLDIVYNPARTELILQAEARNIVSVGGLSMLVAQAARGFELFTGEKYENGIIEKIIDRICRDTQNIILVGMPSCGKSTVGASIAQSLNREFVDADIEFEKTYNISPKDVITTLGEEKFRAMESALLAELGKKSNTVIATGGGAVTRKENYPSLHQNGVIIYIKRNLEALSTENRPLSQNGSLSALFEKRKSAYESFADITVENNGAIENTLKSIDVALQSYTYSCVNYPKKEI